MTEQKNRIHMVDVDVPEIEHAIVYELNMRTFFLILTGCVTITAVAYTYYMHVKVKSQMNKFEIFAKSIASVVKEISTSVIAGAPLLPSNIVEPNNGKVKNLKPEHIHDTI